MEVLIRWALGSSLLILLVLALRLLLRERLSARIRYALWAVVLLRLLIPVQVPMPQAPSPVLSQRLNDYVQREDLYAFRTGPVDIPQESEESMLHSLQPWDVVSSSVSYTSILGIPYYPGCNVITPQGLFHYAFYLPLSQALMLLYVLGVGVLGAVLLWSNRRFSRTLRLDRRLDANCPLPVYVVPGLSSPCLFGLWRPNIYLPPEVAQDETVLRHALAHEYTHFRHWDHIWSALRCLVLVLHWYNPLVWAAAYLSRQDGELACDEGAIRHLGEDERIPYGRTLVSLVAQRGPRPRDVLTCSTTMAQGSWGIRQRVIRLVKRPHTVKTALFLAASALAMVTLVSFVKPPEIHSYQAFLQALDHSDNIQNFRQPLPVYRPDRVEEIRALLASGQEASDSLQPSPDHAGACPLYWLMVKDWKETPSFYLCDCAGEDRLWISTGPVSWQSLAVYPHGTAQRLTELTAVRFLTLEDIQQQLRQADTVYLAASPLSSDTPGAALTDPQLLEELRVLFAQGEPSSRAYIYNHEVHLPAWSARLSLLPPQQWGEEPWDQLLFLEEEDGCHVLTLMRWKDQWYDSMAVLPSGASQTIADLIARQTARG
ncbi:M56 family metallopeptidase [Lawsonibacter sp. LCP25S3_G6]|uniref:M56 family metallopeptidase n=1 Tax=unclassified Lawsonibacter TaxID=2617946 RepID=UPI003F96DABC